MVWYFREAGGETHRKNEGFNVSNRGSDPIEKNISVIDEKGNEYEATYPKRAKGLVKKGRARFVDENTICLACPPDITEDTKMSDNNIKTNVNNTVEAEKKAAEAVEEKRGQSSLDEASEFLPGKNENGGLKEVVADYIGLKTENREPGEPEVTVGYILSQIEKIRKDNEHILKALSSLENLVINNGGGDIANQARSEAIGDAVKCRETTNQKLIEFYGKLYDDIKQAPGEINRVSLIDLITAIERCDAGVMSDETSSALKSVLLERLRADVGSSKTTKEMAIEIVSQAFNRSVNSDSDPEQVAAVAEAISSMLDGIRHIDH